jgi:hypothetical protein
VGSGQVPEEPVVMDGANGTARDDESTLHARSCRRWVLSCKSHVRSRPVDKARWEYSYEEQPVRRLPTLIQDLNEAGADGWEAFAAMAIGVATGTVTVLLKRRLPPG